MKRSIQPLFASVLALAVGSTALAYSKDSAKKKEAPANLVKQLTIDPAASKVEWAGTKKIGGGHSGVVPVKTGTVMMKDGMLTGGKIEIDVANLAVVDIPATEPDNKKLADHLKSDDFFAVAKHPTATVTIQSAKQTAPGKFDVTAEVEIRGTKQTMTFPMEMKTEGTNTMAMGKLSVDRTKFGIKYNSASLNVATAVKVAKDRIINDSFDLSFNVVAKN